MKNPRTVKGWIKKLDDLVREYFRKKFNWTCQRCGKRIVDGKRMNWAHIEGRGKKETRWDLDNGFLMCIKCHFWLDNTDNRLETQLWLERKIGKTKLNELRKRAIKTRQWVLADYEPYFNKKTKEISSVDN